MVVADIVVDTAKHFLLSTATFICTVLPVAGHFVAVAVG